MVEGGAIKGRSGLRSRRRTIYLLTMIAFTPWSTLIGLMTEGATWNGGNVGGAT